MCRLGHAERVSLLAAGSVSMRNQVQNLTVALQDIGGNTLPLPSGSLFVSIEALPGSNAKVTSVETGSQQLTVSRAGSQLKVAPFLVSSATPGDTPAAAM